MKNDTSASIVITPEQALEHWQGHRNLTRRVIEAFPDDKLLTHTIGGMRTFAEMTRELIGIAGMGIQGIANRDWSMSGNFNYWEESSPLAKAKSKSDLLKFWDEVTADINELWPQIPEGRFQEEETAFGQYEGTIWWHLFYFIDNEIHHRGQGYVYLRSLGIEPPYFWER